MTLSQQAGLHIQWHGLVSGAVCLKNKSAHLSGPWSTHILHLGSLVRPVSESKDVIGLSGFASFEFRLLRQIELFEHHSHRIVVEVMLVKDVAQRDVNQYITLHHDEIFLDYAYGWVNLPRCDLLRALGCLQTHLRPTQRPTPPPCRLEWV